MCVQLARDERAEHGAVIARQCHRRGIVTGGVDIEMVVPEIDRNLAQLPARIDRPDQRRRRDLDPGPALFGRGRQLRVASIGWSSVRSGRISSIAG
jgi:hypothetical protein